MKRAIIVGCNSQDGKTAYNFPLGMVLYFSI